MRTVRLVVAYDGTDFHGWQVQPGVRTVQGALEEALRDVLGDDDVSVAGAGRTDAGVHARGQAASFTTRSALPARAITALVNRRLPKDARVRRAEEAPAGFHARHSARGRRYAYRLLTAEDLLLERYAWRVRRRVALERLDRATRPLEREADFAAFRATGSAAVGTVCRVRRARWTAFVGGARLDIVADRFLYRMVRGIVGTALELADERDPGAAMERVLASGDRAMTGVTAPAHGLCLERVYYEEVPA